MDPKEEEYCWLEKIFKTLYDTKGYDETFIILAAKHFKDTAPLYEEATAFDRKYERCKDITNRPWSHGDEFILAIRVYDRESLRPIYPELRPAQRRPPVYVYYTFYIHSSPAKGRSLYLRVPRELGEDATRDAVKTFWKKQFRIPNLSVEAHWDSYTLYYMYAKKKGMCVEYDNLKVSGEVAPDNYLDSLW